MKGTKSTEKIDKFYHARIYPVMPVKLDIPLTIRHDAQLNLFSCQAKECFKRRLFYLLVSRQNSRMKNLDAIKPYGAIIWNIASCLRGLYRLPQHRRMRLSVWHGLDGMVEGSRDASAIVNIIAHKCRAVTA